MFPNVSGLPSEALCDTGFTRADGQKIFVFTSQHPAVVQKHFEQMAANKVNAVAIQRFVSHLSIPSLKSRMDTVLDNALKASQTTGLPFYITYDVSGADSKSVINDIRKDWIDLHSRLSLATNPSYVHTNGHPLVQLWGFGFTDRPGDPSEVKLLIDNLRSGTNLPFTTVMGGVPSSWINLDGDSKSDPAWGSIYGSYDILSPWAAGRYGTAGQATNYINTVQTSQMSMTKNRNQEFLPVIFPGFSWHNLMKARGQDAVLNQIPRDCGRFLQTQVSAQASLGVKSVYLAMFDEMDEGTAFLPTLAHSSEQPVGVSALSLDIDGCNLDSDFYLKQINVISKTLGN